jgi:uridine phosphorylase
MTYLHPTADLAPRVILVDDPGRALALCQVLCDPTPLMFNHARGLWGYSGTGLDGAPLTLQATGIGGPSAAIVVGELAALGASRFVLVGSARGVDGLLVVSAAIAGDGTSRALGAGDRVAPDAALLDALRSAGRVGEVHSRDVLRVDASGNLDTTAHPDTTARTDTTPYRDPTRHPDTTARTETAADLETAAVLQAAARLALPAAALLVGDGADDDLVAAAGRAALTALA